MSFAARMKIGRSIYKDLSVGEILGKTVNQYGN